LPPDAHLADLMQQALRRHRGIAKRKIFDCVSWMLDGYLRCGAETGRFLFRFGKAPQAQARPGATRSPPRRTRRLHFLPGALLTALLTAASVPSAAHHPASAELSLQRDEPACGVAPEAGTLIPADARQRLGGSQVAVGQKDILWAWLADPTPRYPHASLGERQHAGTVHVVLRRPDGRLAQRSLRLPVHRVFEDRNPRLVDLDGDGRDELVLVESDALRGASLVVLGLRPARPVVPGGRPGPHELVELARGPFIGTAFRWLNPLGTADLDGDGKSELLAVHTPHIGGQLTVYRYQPPQLLPLTSTREASNHRLGAVEQQLGVVWTDASAPPDAVTSVSVLVPDIPRRALQWLRWESEGRDGRWVEITHQLPLPSTAERLSPIPGGACLQLANGSWWRVVRAPR
jgi:hypothetical protein